MNGFISRVAMLVASAWLAGVWVFGERFSSGDDNQRLRTLYQAKSDAAVAKGLQWLQTRQLTPARAAALGKPELSGSFQDEFAPGNTGVTALSVMAFLAQGHLPGQGPFGDTINQGIDYLLSQQLDNGLITSRDPAGRRSEMMYSHSIATLLLCEVSGMLDERRQQELDRVLPRALLVLLQAQKVPKAPAHAGGWRYVPGARDSDLSLTGWAIMALRAARQNGAAIPDEHIADAIEYILKCRRADGSFTYIPGMGHGTASMTGLAILCLELCGEHGHEAIQPAAEFLLKNKPMQLKANQLPDPNAPAAKRAFALTAEDQHRYFAFYYCAQAMFQLGDRYWSEFAPYMYDTLLTDQNADGSWGESNVGGYSNTYKTALVVLTLTVSARQLPIYQRDE
ncbi:MAG TPA: terpene cyclase/mutase family protein [Pirellulaceae bacterium]|nr:terpene cyclase/mutase family protein [Pirellulaceae bacterium]